MTDDADNRASKRSPLEEGREEVNRSVRDGESRTS
jgi:hypothetical protein